MLKDGSDSNLVWMNDISLVEDRGNGHHPNEIESKPAQKRNIEAAVREILTNVGEDPGRQGLEGTPDRIARMYEEVLGG